MQKIIISVLALVLLSFSLRRNVKDVPKENDNKVTKEEIIIDKVNALILIGNLEDLACEFYEERGVVLKDIKLPGKLKDLKKKLEPIFLDKPLTNELISEIKREITLFYKNCNYPLISILIPQQEVTSGVLKIVILESKVGKISVYGNKHVKTKEILNRTKLYPGNPVDVDRLLSDVAWMNRNSFQWTNVTLSPGEKRETTDIEFFIKDRVPFRAFAGGNNNGTKFSDRNRMFFGCNWGNIFFYNEIFSYQYTSSLDLNKFWAHTANYTAFLPNYHTLVLFGGYSQVRPKLSGLKSRGKSAQASFRYEVPIGKIYKKLQQSINFGFDYKFTNNNVAAVNEKGNIRITNSVNITQFLLEYQLSNKSMKNKFRLLSGLVFSPIKWMSDQNKKAYGNIRPGADPRYVYFKLLLRNIYDMKGAKIDFMTRFQLASSKLLPTEQFELGGQDTVRGYENRLISRDNIICSNLEIIIPPMVFFKKLEDVFKILAFCDFGYGWNHSNKNKNTLLGMGVGARYSIRNNLQLKFDWGIPICKVVGEKSNQIYFQTVLSY